MEYILAIVMIVAPGMGTTAFTNSVVPVTFTSQAACEQAGKDMVASEKAAMAAAPKGYGKATTFVYSCTGVKK